MSDAERQAFEQLLNTWLQHAIVIFALGWWAVRTWRRLGLPGVNLSRYWTLRPRETVDTEPEASLTGDADQAADDRTDERTDRTTSPDIVQRLLQVDRTRKGAVKAFVQAGWTVAQIRAVLKGENATISQEIAAAKAELESEPPIVVRDHAGERLISR